MNEMIERMARTLALCYAKRLPEYIDGTGDPCLWANHAWEGFSGDARAAIAAMREPQAEGISNVYAAFDAAEPDGVMGPRGAIAVWQTMIDEAVK